MEREGFKGAGSCVLVEHGRNVEYIYCRLRAARGDVMVMWRCEWILKPPGQWDSRSTNSLPLLVKDLEPPRVMEIILRFKWKSHEISRTITFCIVYACSFSE